MHRRLVPLLLVALIPCVRADEPPKMPRIEWAEKEFLFEKTLQGQKVSHAFGFKNVGTAELVIRKVETTCGCTVGKVSKDRLAPGETGSIELVLDTKDKLGAATLVRATVFSNDPKENGVGPCTTLLELKGEVVTSFHLRPTGAWFGQILRGAKEEATREIRVYGDLEAKKGFKVALETMPPWCKVDVRPLDPPEFYDGMGGYCLKVRVLPHVPAGDFMQYVEVKTDVKSQPSFRFPLVGVALNPVRAIPEAITFERVRRGTEVERVVQIERTDEKRGLRLLAIEYDEALLQVTPQTVIEGARIDLTVKLRKDVPPGVISTELRVRTDEPQAPYLRWPVFADVRPRCAPDPALVLLANGHAEVVVPVDGGTLRAVTAVPADAFEVTLEPAAGERPARVKLAARRALAANEKAHLLLETDVAGEERVTVPIHALAPAKAP